MTPLRASAAALALAASPLWLPVSPGAAAQTSHVADAAWYWSVVDTTGTGPAGAISSASGVPAGDLAVAYTNTPDKASALLFNPDTLGRDPGSITAFVASFSLDPAATQVAPATTPVLACPLLARVVNSTSAQPLASLPAHGSRCATGTWSADKTKVVFDLRTTAEGWSAGESLTGLVLVLPDTVTTPTQNVFIREPVLTVTVASAASVTPETVPVTTPVPQATAPMSGTASALVGGSGSPVGSSPATQPVPAVAPPLTAPGPAQPLLRASSAAAVRPFSRPALVLAGLATVALLVCCGL
ncbi:MAG: hypothetical protein JWO27_313, partial [Frankiales bacterium]|nr:hypothetical protein [Frankiales bacterium]